jgi:ABC-type polysaccharide/polyol phosphate export permease
MFLRVLRERRSLVSELVRRDFAKRFVGSAAGWLWTIIHPLVLLVSWVFVFQWCLKVPPPPGAGDNYTLYLFCGYLPWLLFQETVQRSATVLTESSNLITKTVFPSEILPLTVFLSSLISHAIGVGVAFSAVLWYTGAVGAQVLLIPLYTAALGLFAVGFSWVASSLQVYLRDTAQVVIVLLTGWFWLTPIFLDVTHFPENARFLVWGNPLAPVVQAYRSCLMGTAPPAADAVAFLAAASLATFVFGGLFFRHLKRGFADVL